MLELFHYFPYATSIVIKTDGEVRNHSYPFNIFSFLNIIKDVLTWKTIKIVQMMNGKEYENKSWITKLWQSNKHSIIEGYAMCKLTIEYDKKRIDIDEKDKAAGVRIVKETGGLLCWESLIVKRLID